MRISHAPNDSSASETRKTGCFLFYWDLERIGLQRTAAKADQF